MTKKLAAAVFLLVLTFTALACSPNDAKLNKLRSKGRHGSISVYGVLTHSCPQAVGFKLKLVVFDKNKEIVVVDDSWPASISNIAPNEPYYFVLMADDGGRGKSFTVTPVDVRRWNK